MRYILIFVFTIFSCKAPLTIQPSQAESEFENGTIIGSTKNNLLNEISGLVASRQNKGMFWVHNDSGDENKIYLIDSLAQLKATFILKNITNRDWEDIAITTINGINWIYIADTGDNQSLFDTKYIYRFKEPNLNDNPSIDAIEKINFQYSDGSRDAETLLIDHNTQELFIVSKRENKKRLYQLNFVPNTSQIANFKGEIAFSENTSSIPQIITSQYIVGGDISPDNQEIIIKNYVQIFYWKRKLNESLIETLNRSPKILPYTVEPQGEAITFKTDGNGYYTLSEASTLNEVNLYFYKKK